MCSLVRGKQVDGFTIISIARQPYTRAPAAVGSRERMLEITISLRKRKAQSADSRRVNELSKINVYITLSNAYVLGESYIYVDSCLVFTVENKIDF